MKGIWSKKMEKKEYSLSIGKILTDARLEKKETLSDISKTLHIRLDHLKALENDEYHILPGTAYVIGFLRTYAQYLHLNADLLIDSYKKSDILTSSEEWKVSRNIQIKTLIPSGIPKYIFIGALIIGSLCLAMGLFYIMYDDTEQMNEILNTELSKQKQYTTNGIVASPKMNVKIRAKKTVWLQIKTKQKKLLFSSLLKQGAEYIFPRGNDFVISTHNAGYLIYVVNDSAFIPLGTYGQRLYEQSLSLSGLNKKFMQKNK